MDKLYKRMIDVLTDQLSVKDAQIKMLFEALSPEQKQQLRPHLRLVKED